jgi:hypothetical protein
VKGLCEDRDVARPPVADPTDASRDDNWHGGYYELSIKLGAHDDARLDAALKSLWEAAGLLRGIRRNATGPAPEPTQVSAESLLAGTLNSVATVPGLGSTLCSVLVVREETYEAGVTKYGADWLDLCLPLGALSNLDHRVGAYPFDDTARSRTWREPIERWFADIGRAVFQTVPFVHAVTGFEVSGVEPSEVTPGRVAVFRPTEAGTLTIEPVTNF